MDTIVKVCLAAFAIAYVGIVYIWRIYAVWRKTGICPVTYGGMLTVHDVIGKIFAILVSLSIGSIVIYVLFPERYEYLIPLRMLEAATTQVAGLILAWLSMVWTIIAQRQMGTAWRIGIDTRNSTELVHQGLFNLTRHPIYLGVATTSASLFLVMPSLVTLGLLVATIISLLIQARLEEEYLERVHGEDFTKYARRIQRWL